jgi:RNase P protein component
MTIAAYLDKEDDPEINRISELTPSQYQGLANVLAIDKAEQSIIDEVTGVDGDEADDEAEEAAEEKELKSLFESLYEIDPETKEPFVKGSAYDLKKWDESMICFAFGSEEEAIALEDYRSPGEKYFQKMFDRVGTKETELSQFIRSKRSCIDSGTVDKNFAKGYAAVMGHPMQNVRMESFTNEPTATNFKIAMEEMTQQQMALAAGGAVLGVGLVYKMIQWFAKALNKNTLATSSIKENFSAFTSRKEMLKNGKYELAIAKDTVKQAVDKLVADYSSKIKEIGQAPGLLSDALSKEDPAAVFSILTSLEAKTVLKGKYNLFIKQLIEGKIGSTFWSNLNTLTNDAIVAQTTIGSSIEYMLDNRRINEEKPKPVDFKFLNTITLLVKELGIEIGGNGFVAFNPSTNNAEECINSFNAIADQQLFIVKEGEPDFNAQQLNNNNSFEMISTETFGNFSNEYIDNLIDSAKQIEELASKYHGENEVKDNTDKVEIANKRNRVKELVKEFKLVSSILRFVIRVRNQLGTLALAMNKVSESTLSKIQSYFKGIGSTAASVIDSVKEATDLVGSGFRGDTKKRT